jgi:hypothetical protein
MLFDRFTLPKHNPEFVARLTKTIKMPTERERSSAPEGSIACVETRRSFFQREKYVQPSLKCPITVCPLVCPRHAWTDWYPPLASLLRSLINNWNIYCYTNPYQPGHVGHKSLILHDPLATNQKVGCSSQPGRTMKSIVQKMSTDKTFHQLFINWRMGYAFECRFPTFFITERSKSATALR